MEISLIFDLISLIFVILAIIVNFINGTKSYKQYKERKSTLTILFSCTTLSLALAMLFLMIRVIVTEIDVFLGVHVFSNIAMIFSGMCIIFVDAFAFHIVFPKRLKVLTFISGIFVSIAIGFSVFDYKVVSNGEITYVWDPLYIGIPLTNLIQIAIIPLFSLIPALVFFYYAIIIKEESKMKSKRAWTLGLGMLIVAISYTMDMIGLPSIIFIFRSLYFVSAILIYRAMFQIVDEE